MSVINMKKNFIWNTIGVLSISLTSFIYTLILKRLCNLSVTGIWSYTFAVACTSVTLASFGGRTYQVTDIKNELPTFTYISSRYATVAITFLFILIFAFFKGFDLNKSLILIFLCMFKFCEELSDVYYGILQKNDSLDIVGKSMCFKSIFNMLLFFSAIYFKQSLLLATILILINNFLFIYLYDRHNAIKFEKIKKIWNKENYTKYFKNNLVICIFLFLSTYLVNCPKYVMNSYLSDELQGIYNILVLPATAVTLIGSFIINPLLVSISKDYADNNIKCIKTTSNKIVLCLCGFGVVFLILGYIFGIPVLRLVYDFNLKPYLYDFLLIIIGCTFYTISTVLSTILISTRKLKSQLIINLILSIISYILCLVMIKNYSITGGVYAYTIIMFIRFIIYIVLVNNLKVSSK